MEATASPTLINNLAATVILNFNFKVFINLLFYSAAATTGVLATNKIITLAFEELIKALRYRWEAKYKDKKELAIAVIRILTEGSTAGWCVKPRDMEHVYFIARLLEGVDKKASTLFDQCIGSWQLSAQMQDELFKMPLTKENMKYFNELQKRAQEGCEGVLKIVQKWR